MIVIHDGPADGPTNMARDLALLAELADEAILRTYDWQGDWVSYGYFQNADDAERHFPNIPAVRRPTGGGLVDHRKDFTYSLFFPKKHPLARVRRAECYQIIHTKIVEALQSFGLAANLISEELGNSPACFVHPVPGDVINENGHKLAGAAQRRTRRGLLHQGSILTPLPKAPLKKEIRNALTTL